MGDDVCNICRQPGAGEYQSHRTRLDCVNALLARLQAVEADLRYARESWHLVDTKLQHETGRAEQAEQRVAGLVEALRKAIRSLEFHAEVPPHGYQCGTKSCCAHRTLPELQDILATVASGTQGNASATPEGPRRE